MMLTVTNCQHHFESFEEYLLYNDNSEKFYELFNVKLIARPPESGFNVEIATFLLLKFDEILGYRSRD